MHSITCRSLVGNKVEKFRFLFIIPLPPPLPHPFLPDANHIIPVPAKWGYKNETSLPPPPCPAARPQPRPVAAARSTAAFRGIRLPLRPARVAAAGSERTPGAAAWRGHGSVLVQAAAAPPFEHPVLKFIDRGDRKFNTAAAVVFLAVRVVALALFYWLFCAGGGASLFKASHVGTIN